jgi:hypothetical protein
LGFDSKEIKEKAMYLGQEMIVPEDDDVTGGQIMIVPEDEDIDEIDEIPDVEGMGRHGWGKSRRRRRPRFNLRRYRALQLAKRKKQALMQLLLRQRLAAGGAGAFIGRPTGIDISASPTGSSYMKPARQVVLDPSGIPVVSGHGLRVHKPGYRVTTSGGLYTERTAPTLTSEGIPITGRDVSIDSRINTKLQAGLGASLYFENAAGKGANIQMDGVGASLYFEDDAGEGANIRMDGIF